jgi:hypothetical protein
MDQENSVTLEKQVLFNFIKLSNLDDLKNQVLFSPQNKYLKIDFNLFGLI